MELFSLLYWLILKFQIDVLYKVDNIFIALTYCSVGAEAEAGPQVAAARFADQACTATHEVSAAAAGHP